MKALTDILKKHPRVNKSYCLKADTGLWHPVLNKNYCHVVFENNSDSWLVKDSYFTYINGKRTLIVKLQLANVI